MRARNDLLWMAVGLVLTLPAVAGGQDRRGAELPKEVEEQLTKSLSATERTLMASLTRSEKWDPGTKIHGIRMPLWWAAPETTQKEAKQLVAKDRKAILSVLPDVVERYRGIGLDTAKICQGTCSAWLHLRLSHERIEGRLSGETFAKFVSDWCYTKVESEPDGAKVILDRTPWGATETDGFLKKGDHTITVTKEPDYQPLTSTEKVRPNQINKFKYVLKPSS